jgi:hypothetical protein
VLRHASSVRHGCNASVFGERATTFGVQGLSLSAHEGAVPLGHDPFPVAPADTVSPDVGTVQSVIVQMCNALSDRLDVISSRVDPNPNAGGFANPQASCPKNVYTP